MTLVIDDLAVCTDCAVLIANGEGTEEHGAAMVRAWADTARGPMGLVLDGSDGEWFSSSPCDGCGSTLAGNRHPAAYIE